MIGRQHIEFIAKNQSGWSIGNTGAPRIWWKARMKALYPMLLSDGRDAHECEANVTISLGSQTPIGKTLYTGAGMPAAKWGYFGYQKHFDWIEVYIAVSTENFDRILSSTRQASLPTLRLGFGPEGGFDELTGPITPNESRDGYLWNSAEKPSVVVAYSGRS